MRPSICSSIAPRRSPRSVRRRRSTRPSTGSNCSAFLRVVGLHQRADHAGCRARIDDALALAIASADAVIEAECRFSKGVYATHDGRLGEAVEHLAAAEALHRGIGRGQRALAIELNIGIVLLWTGQARLTLERLRHALPRVLESSSSKMLAALLVLQADSELYLGEIGDASATAVRALAALRSTDMIGAELASTARSIAEAQRRSGHWDEALEVVVETQQRLGAQRDPEQLLASALAEIYLDLGRPDLTRRQIEAFEAVSQHSARQRQRALTLRWRYGLATGIAIDTAAAVAEAFASENLLLACRLVLVAGQAIQPTLTSAEVETVIARCEPEGLREELAPLHALHAHLLAREGDSRSADASVALSQSALLQGEIGAATPLCDLWLALALQRLERPEEAALQARRGSAWLGERAERSVPEAFRESFLRRNPVHARLLSWPQA